MNLTKELFDKETSICVVGLGYVGLPLLLNLAENFNVIGFDISSKRIDMLRKHIDPSKEVSKERFELADMDTPVEYTFDVSRISECKFIIIAVPTPIDKFQNPDLEALQFASEIVGENLSKGSIVVYESTVYPGATEDVCIPRLELYSFGICGKDFNVGYSPERINPGDKIHRLDNIVKVISAQNKKTLKVISNVYQCVTSAGVHEAPSIKVAEAAKVIENTQRDINIALMNELSIIFNRLNIDTNEVLEASRTKWNFLDFSPGLVGGHCIGVDPYYLTHKAKEVGYNPEMILAGRRINDDMGKMIASETIKSMIKLGTNINKATIVVMGLTFKENVSDIRNTKVIDIINELKTYNVNIEVWDPHADVKHVRDEFGIKLVKHEKLSKASAIICATPHREFYFLKPEFIKKMYAKSIKPLLVDVRRVFDKKEMKKLNINYWGL